MLFFVLVIVVCDLYKTYNDLKQLRNNALNDQRFNNIQEMQDANHVDQQQQPNDNQNNQQNNNHIDQQQIDNIKKADLNKLKTDKAHFDEIYKQHHAQCKNAYDDLKDFANRHNIDDRTCSNIYVDASHLHLQFNMDDYNLELPPTIQQKNEFESELSNIYNRIRDNAIQSNNAYIQLDRLEYLINLFEKQIH